MRKLTARRTLSLLTPVLALVMASTACVYVEKDDSDSGPDPGHVEVSWAMGGRSCTEAGVFTINVRLTDLEGTTYAEESGTCDERRVLVGPLSPGVYKLIVQGSSRDGVITHSGSLDAVVVAEGLTSEPDVVNLAARGATVKVSWRFANGNLCSFNEVDQVQIAIFDDLSREVHLMNYSCDPDGHIRIPDVPAGQVDIFATALDAGNKPKFKDVERIETSFGLEAEVLLVLEDCERREDGC